VLAAFAFLEELRVEAVQQPSWGCRDVLAEDPAAPGDSLLI
jgi:hypothetical protein